MQSNQQSSNGGSSRTKCVGTALLMFFMLSLIAQLDCVQAQLPQLAGDQSSNQFGNIIPNGQDVAFSNDINRDLIMPEP